MQYLTNKTYLTGTKYSLDEIVGVYGGATFDIQNNQLFAYTVFHNEATVEDLPIKTGCANHFSLYFPEKQRLVNGVHIDILNRQDKINILASVIREYFGQAVGQSEVIGYWLQDQNLVQENIIRLEWWSDFTSEEYLESLIDLCKFLKARLYQDSIGVEVNEDLFILI